MKQAYAWRTPDDNRYHYYTIYLSPYGLTSTFWIAFDANMSNTLDYFYIDDIQVIAVRSFCITVTSGTHVLKVSVDVDPDTGQETVWGWYYLS